MASTSSIGLSGMSVSQRLLDLVGQNIANANTEGYHRQVASLSARSAGQEVGLGVEITQVRRLIDQALEHAITRNTFESSDVTAQLQTMRQVEANLAPSDGAVNGLLETFFNEAEKLAAQPSDLTQRRVFLSAASALADGLNSQATALDQIRADLS